MALAKEMMGGCSLINLSTSIMLVSDMSLVARPALVMPLQKRRMRGRRMATKGPVAAISEDIIRTNISSSSNSDISNFVVGQDQRGKRVFKARAVLTVKKKIKEDFQETLLKQLDAFADIFGRNVVLELISTEVDPKTNEPKRSREAVLKDWSKKSNVKTERVHYTAEFSISSDFGEVGAIAMRNKHQKEFFLENITLEIEGFPSGPVHFPCNSWVQSTKDLPGKRIFFSNKPYLPSETPAGLRALRENELKELRGDGQGVRKPSDRIYDYDVYNDLGKPDTSLDFTRPILGGKAIPYPRRCRTGRLPSHTDINVESRVEKPVPLYVPRDEQFEEIKRNTFLNGRSKAVLHNLLPSLRTKISSENEDFKTFSDIDLLYKEGLIVRVGLQDEIWKKLPLPSVVTRLEDSSESLLKYDIPKIVEKDRFSWWRDEEFARQFLAGINPSTIERVTVFPPKSSLDPEVHGSVESALKEEHILGFLNGMSVQQAIDEKKLFIVDYHDVYLPFVDKINALDGRKTYATRTLFFLTPMGTLKPIAIELSLPSVGPSTRSRRVVTPPLDATTSWVWLLAKAHVVSNDAGAHQLVHHWLRTHASMEPFIIAAHRQLSAMHPIFKLLDPHMRYTMEINALARQNLINADGVIENCFTPGRYNMEISAAAYKSVWRFDKETLPEDLIRRGMAVRDPTQPLGVKLVFEDYPYAQDGLLIFQEIQNWVCRYVNHYYPDSSIVCNDKELQSWYSEAVNVGHADVRDADWWPTLANADDLVLILTTLIWLVSAQHAALNFGQYPYGGYVPNRPALMRRLIPQENDPEYANFQADPQKFFLSSLPSMLQATKLMAVIDTLSTHSADEEYLGEQKHPLTWTGDAEMIQEFHNFSAAIRQVEKEIDRRNNDPRLKNRCGAGVLPYELLAPSSGPGVTCRGIPNSVTI